MWAQSLRVQAIVMGAAQRGWSHCYQEADGDECWGAAPLCPFYAAQNSRTTLRGQVYFCLNSIL